MCRVERLTSDLAEYKRDAERWLYLRSFITANDISIILSRPIITGDDESGDYADAAIDAAREKT